jgi:hypothetical protein
LSSGEARHQGYQERPRELFGLLSEAEARTMHAETMAQFQAMERRQASMQHQLNTIASKESDIMAAVQVDQADLDALAASLEDVKTSLSTEIQNLQAAGNLPAGSLDGLKQALTDLQSLEPPPAAPTG